jgi:NAD(P)-dependent dehydrogenase (short-subunit alcohol dehydrogenase family)
MNAIRDALDFTGRQVLVVGASRGGIGAAAAAAFAACGASVVITGAEAAPIEADRGRYPYRQLDVTEEPAVAALAQGFGRLDALINCAGMAVPIAEFEPAVFNRVLDVNLTGQLRVASAFRSRLAESRGSIVNVVSMYAAFGSPRVPAYGASKAGLAQLTRSLAIAWAADGIRVNAVAPGFVETEQTAARVDEPEHVRRVVERTPMGRWGVPEDVAGPVLFLCSPLARFMTGAILPVDGGYSAG